MCITLTIVQRSCSSLYRLLRFINCPTCITLHHIIFPPAHADLPDIPRHRKTLSDRGDGVFSPVVNAEFPERGMRADRMFR